MLFKNALVAVGVLASTASASSRWKQVLQAYNFPDTVQADSAINISTYTVQMHPKAYGTVNLEPQYYKSKGSKKVEIKYGNFTVPPMSENNGMTDYLQIGTPMPCTDCTITTISAGLEYPNGTYANANTSLWLHHIIFIDVVTPDTVCGSQYYGHGQRWFASGNERSPVDFTAGGRVPAGYYVSPSSYNVMLVELMNEMDVPQEAIATVTFEYIPGQLPSDFWGIRPIWLDIAGCHIASEMPPKTNTTFTYEMDPVYTSQYSGAVTDQGSHVHDGGVKAIIYQNDNEQCDCVASYGGTPGYISPVGGMMGMAMGNEMSSSMDMSMAMSSTMDSSMPMSTALTWSDGTNGSSLRDREHISSITGCFAPTTYISVGDTLKNKVWYDFNTHAPMLDNDGTIADIMGISVIYMAENMTMSQMTKFVGTKAEAASSSAMMMGTTSMNMATGAGMSMTMAMSSSTGAAAAAAAGPGVVGTAGGLLGGVLAALALW